MELSLIHSGSYREGLKPGEVPQLMYNKLAIILTDTIEEFFPLKSVELCQVALVVTLAIKLHVVFNL